MEKLAEAAKIMDGAGIAFHFIAMTEKGIAVQSNIKTDALPSILAEVYGQTYVQAYMEKVKQDPDARSN